MEVFQLVLALLLAAAVLTVVAERVRAPYPSLLALAGTAVAFLPLAPSPPLDPQLALALFVAPVLLDAAYDASPRDLRDNAIPVALLVLVAVTLTVLGVAVVARMIVPDMSWPVAIALGGIVAPPDAAAATAVLRSVNAPHRIMVILEGESLLNDASALLIYRVALGAAAGDGVSVPHAAWLLILSCGGGAVLGVALAWLYIRLTRAIDDIAISVTTQFVGTFATWLLADRLGVSAIITMVAYAIAISRLSATTSGAEHRRASFAVWDVVVFVLNALAFILVGLQMRQIAARADGHLWEYAGFALAILAATILVRIAWVMTYNTSVRWKNRRFGVHVARDQMMLPTFKGGIVVSWCGMRGIVTLAAALALPAELPFRDLLLTAAFAVVLGTLVIQGLTLGPLLRRLRMPQDPAVERETAAARAALARVALQVLEASDHPAAPQLRGEYWVHLREESQDAEGRAEIPPSHGVRLEIIAAQRRALADLRRRRAIGDDAFHAVEEDLDWAEGHANRQSRAAPELARPA